MSLSASITLALASSLPLAHGAPAAAGGQCRPPETTYFSCSTARHKTISLCGSLPGSLQYRYGKAPHVELLYPSSPGDGVRQLRYAHYFRFQSDRTEVTFSRRGYDYAVFDYTDEGKRSAGVRVTAPDGTEHDVLCSGPIQGRLAPLGKSLRCDADNALNGGNCP
ncbi:MAG: hypothetical protein KGN77_00115 [Xanthomonadaceae bacterium]|nr:hypothetical protein [Xanthomonadaceae bacterium]MDE1962898.1 hypothetical protein [Xanthomonadaceae bacterium]